MKTLKINIIQFLVLLITLCLSQLSFADVANINCDIILLRDGAEISAKVITISQGKIEYKKCDFQEGPTYTVTKSEVFMIKYPNGQKDIMKASTPKVNQSMASGFNAEKQQTAIMNSSSVPIPEYAAVPYILNNSGSLNSLERTSATIEVKLKAFGYGGAAGYLTTFPGRSNVRFNGRNIPKIILKMDVNGNPEDYIAVVKASKKKSKKDRRRFQQADYSMTGNVRDISESKISFSMKKIQENIYELVFNQSLEPGEYAFMPMSDDQVNGSKIKISCFGID